MIARNGRRHRLIVGTRWLSCIGLALVLAFGFIDMYLRITGDTLMTSPGGNAVWASIGIGSLPLLNLPIAWGFKIAFVIPYLLGMTALNWLLLLLLSPS